MMKIKCDVCKTEYSMPDVSSGRVRCAVCGNVWHVSRKSGRNSLLVFFAALCALLAATMFAAGLDPLVGVATILLGAGSGVLGSTINPFATGVALSAMKDAGIKKVDISEVVKMHNNNLYTIELSELGLSTGTLKCLEKEDIETFGDLVDKKEILKDEISNDEISEELDELIENYVNSALNGEE